MPGHNCIFETFRACRCMLYGSFALQCRDCLCVWMTFSPSSSMEMHENNFSWIWFLCLSLSLESISVAPTSNKQIVPFRLNRQIPSEICCWLWIKTRLAYCCYTACHSVLSKWRCRMGEWVNGWDNNEKMVSFKGSLLCTELMARHRECPLLFAPWHHTSRASLFTLCLTIIYHFSQVFRKWMKGTEKKKLSIDSDNL